MRAPRRWGRGCRRSRAGSHRLQEDIFQGIAAVIHAPYLYGMLRSETIELAQVDIVRKHDLECSRAEAGAFAPQRADRFHEAVALRDIQLKELQFGFAFF